MQNSITVDLFQLNVKWSSGTIRSYNYAQPQLLAAQQFNHCIRQV